MSGHLAQRRAAGLSHPGKSPCSAQPGPGASLGCQDVPGLSGKPCKELGGETSPILGASTSSSPSSAHLGAFPTSATGSLGVGEQGRRAGVQQRQAGGEGRSEKFFPGLKALWQEGLSLQITTVI